MAVALSYVVGTNTSNGRSFSASPVDGDGLVGTTVVGATVVETAVVGTVVVGTAVVGTAVVGTALVGTLAAAVSTDTFAMVVGGADAVTGAEVVAPEAHAVSPAARRNAVK
jgi:hypothetical protein